MKKVLFGITLAAAAFTFGACGGGGGMSADMPTKAATELHTMVKTDYDSVMGSWSSAQENAGKISEASGVDVAALTDIDGFKSALIECYNTPVKAMEKAAKDETKDGAVEAADAQKTAMIGYDSLEGCSTDTVSGLSETGDESVKAFYTSKLDQVDKMRMDLLYIIPNNATALAEGAPMVIEEIAKIRGQAEAALAAKENNPLASAADKTKAKEDYDAVIANLDEVQKLAEAIPTDLAAIPADAAALGAKIVSDLEAFPKAGEAGAGGGEEGGDAGGEDAGGDS